MFAASMKILKIYGVSDGIPVLPVGSLVRSFFLLKKHFNERHEREGDGFQLYRVFMHAIAAGRRFLVVSN